MRWSAWEINQIRRCLLIQDGFIVLIGANTMVYIIHIRLDLYSEYYSDGGGGHGTLERYERFTIIIL